jgi:hypothetical protein
VWLSAVHDKRPLLPELISLWSERRAVAYQGELDDGVDLGLVEVLVLERTTPRRASRWPTTLLRLLHGRRPWD